MTFKIGAFLDAAAANDQQVRDQVISIHDDLYAAYKIIDSAASAFGPGASRSDEVLLAVFRELRAYSSS